MSEETEAEDSELPRVLNSAEELETGIFSMVLTLAHTHARTMTPTQAREATAAWLEQLIVGLRMEREQKDA